MLFPSDFGKDFFVKNLYGFRENFVKGGGGRSPLYDMNLCSLLYFSSAPDA